MAAKSPPVRRWYHLEPVEPGPWVWPGLALEFLGIAGPVVYVLIQAKRQSLGGSLSLATVKLSWHQSVHSRGGLAVLIGGALLVALGAALMARPSVSNLLILVLAVPVAAVVGLLLLGGGVLALVLVLVVIWYEPAFASDLLPEPKTRWQWRRPKPAPQDPPS